MFVEDTYKILFAKTTQTCRCPITGEPFQSFLFFRFGGVGWHVRHTQWSSRLLRFGLRRDRRFYGALGGCHRLGYGHWLCILRGLALLRLEIGRLFCEMLWCVSYLCLRRMVLVMNRTRSGRLWQRWRHRRFERIWNWCAHWVLVGRVYLVIQRRGSHSRRSGWKVWTGSRTRNLLLLGHSGRCFSSFAVCFLQSLGIVFRIVWNICRRRNIAAFIVAANCCRRFRGSINRHGGSFPLSGKSSQFPFVFVITRHRRSFVVITHPTGRIVSGVIFGHVLWIPNFQDSFRVSGVVFSLAFRYSVTSTSIARNRIQILQSLLRCTSRVLIRRSLEEGTSDVAPWIEETS